MKQKLFFLSIFFAASLSGQTLQSDDFNALSLGNVGTDITGVTGGQGGWLTTSSNGNAPTTSTNANNSNFQIVSSGNASTQGVEILGPDGGAGVRYMWKDGLSTAWASRTSGNDIIEVEVDVNPGSRGTSLNSFGIRIYDATFNQTLAGFQVDSNTGQLRLIAYSAPSGNPVGNYIYGLSAAPGFLLPENTWSRVGVSFNKTTGEVLINCNLFSTALPLTGAAAGTDPAEVDFIVLSGSSSTTTNSAATSMTFDNFVVRASNTDTLLSTQSVDLLTNDFTIYPNPANDVINISSTLAVIKNAVITDVNGRIVKEISSLNNNQIDISNLNSGIYFLSIESSEGKAIKKFIKK